ncbi:hypothetical protein MHU86_1053 [Fragilaria crotonensis]|nr:hypothetical protein MHU86_1053 [Fragilaria crotonensis]
MNKQCPNSDAPFLERHPDKLLVSLELKHIVQDPNSRTTGSDLQKIASVVDDVDAYDCCSIRKLRYGSVEGGRLLLTKWHLYKANRACYKEHLFNQGKLGLVR